MQLEMCTAERAFCVCKFCGEKIEGKSPSAIFCSDACRLRWFRFKHRVTLSAERGASAVAELEYFLEHEETRQQAARALMAMREHLDEIVDGLSASSLDWLK